MSLFSKPQDSPEPIEVTDDLVGEVEEAVAEHGEMLSVRPYRGDGELMDAKQLLTDIHEVKSKGWQDENHTPPISFEPVYADDAINYRFAAIDDRTRNVLERQIPNFYRDADVSRIPAEFVPMKKGQYLAAARLELFDSDYFKPIKRFEVTPEEFENDPYGSIIPEMIGSRSGHSATVSTLVQVVIRPAWSNHKKDKKNWHYNAEHTANRLEDGETGWRPTAVLEEMATAFTGGSSDDIEHTKTKSTTTEQKQAADVVRNQRGKMGYHLNIRVLSVADDPTEAVERVEDTAGMYRRFYASTYEQGFDPVWADSNEAADVARQMARREWIDRDMILSAGALAGVCHIPTTLATPEIDYSRTSGSGSTPAESPEFDTFRDENEGEEAGE